MADKTMPTPGPWYAVNEGRVFDIRPTKIAVKGAANAHLIAAAGTAAHEVAQMGYDPVEAVRALPGLIRDLAHDTDHGWVRDWITRAAGKEGDDGQ